MFSDLTDFSFSMLRTVLVVVGLACVQAGFNSINKDVVVKS